MKERKQKTEKTPVLRGHGHINVSNVNSAQSECITFTYSAKNIKTLKEAAEIKKAFDDLSSQDGGYEVLIENYGTKEETISSKYKLKLCDSEQSARDVKKDLDQYIKKKGGQTTLTEDFDKAEKEEAKAQQ